MSPKLVIQEKRGGGWAAAALALKRRKHMNDINMKDSQIISMFTLLTCISHSVRGLSPSRCASPWSSLMFGSFWRFSHSA